MARSQDKFMVCTIHGEPDALEAGAWILFETGAEGVIENDSGENPSISAYFPEDRWESLKPLLLGHLESAQAQFPSLKLDEEKVVDRADWSEKWKEFHKPVTMGSLWIGPPWLKDEADPDKTALIIDPGQAFGTGGHETTKICLALLSGWVNDAGEGRLLDVGTGSGVLALAGLSLGLDSALALDNDPLAVEAALLNGEVNGLSANLQVSDQDLSEIEEKFPLVTANLTRPILKENAKDLIRVLQPGGNIIISGILIEETDDIRRIFRELKFVKAIQIGEWTGIVMEKPGEG